MEQQTSGRHKTRVGRGTYSNSGHYKIQMDDSNAVKLYLTFIEGVK